MLNMNMLVEASLKHNRIKSELGKHKETHARGNKVEFKFFAFVEEESSEMFVL